ncbi:MAG: hypothetical protein A2Z20_06885 [Bdellovibrionales bacterium RBG_16_40_8]|nr:MAG: hypothetical protein A2Z20_06885 [Bdellovibrionales bacterium RBG_16_40_8]
MDLSATAKIPFLFFGAWPAIFAIIFGLALLLVFQTMKKFRNFFGLAFLALPGCTLAVFGVLGIGYASVEINKSVSKISLNSRQIIKENESELIEKIKNGFYVEAGKSLKSIRDKGGLSFVVLYLIPTNELVAQAGKPITNSKETTPNHILISHDLDGSIIEWGRLEFQLDSQILHGKIKEIADHLAIFMINMGLGSLISSLLLAFYFFRHLKRPSLFVNNLRKAVTDSKDVEDLLTRMNSIDYNGAFLEEELHLKHNLKVITIGMTELQNRWLKNETDAILGRMASQVSHDIRSPLSALNMILTTLGELPEDKRLIIRNSTQRINDIANLLLQKGKDKSKPQNSSQILDGEPIMLVALLESIVSEKRAQFRQKLEVDIQSNILSGYGLFAKIDSTELTRAISNAVNNSVEAFSGKGSVTIGLAGDSDYAIVTIKDTGKGIPKHILEKLGQRGITHGKEGTQSGSGLGVFQAKTTVEAAGGKYEISSEENKGTVITMKLPKAKAPWWFLEKLSFAPGATIVSLDDDSTIHQIWAERFKDKLLSTLDLNHVTFSSTEAFEDWLPMQEFQDVHFLIDFEFLNQQGNGLDVIERNKIAGQSVLVTSRFDEVRVRNRSKQLGVKILPKGLAPFVPIQERKEKQYFDAILIDDDASLMHVIWKMAANECGKSIRCFARAQDFYEAADTIDPKSNIFIDVSLSDGIRGEDVALSVHKLGFTEIALSTGYDSSSITPPNCVKKVIGKDPAFTVSIS